MSNIFISNASIEDLLEVLRYSFDKYGEAIEQSKDDTKRWKECLQDICTEFPKVDILEAKCKNFAKKSISELRLFLKDTLNRLNFFISILNDIIEKTKNLLNSLIKIGDNSSIVEDLNYFTENLIRLKKHLYKCHNIAHDFSITAKTPPEINNNIKYAPYRLSVLHYYNMNKDNINTKRALAEISAEILGISPDNAKKYLNGNLPIKTKWDTEAQEFVNSRTK